MSPEKLVYMVNQMAKFFAHEPRDQAIADVADHITRFWDPRMRNAIFAHLDQGGAGLDDISLEAVKALKLAADRKKIAAASN